MTDTKIIKPCKCCEKLPWHYTNNTFYVLYCCGYEVKAIIDDINSTLALENGIVLWNELMESEAQNDNG
jgi:hypothetical protein